MAVKEIFSEPRMFRLNNLSALISRAQLAATLGYSYEGERNLYQALGYDTSITYSQYAAAYERQDMAKAVIDRPVQATWRGGFTLVESDDDEDTELEKAWKKLYLKLALRAKFARLDRLSGLGKYGVLLLGLSDVTDIQGFSKPVTKGRNLDLLYVRPFSGFTTDGSAQIIEYEQNPASERYGKPVIYQIQIKNLTTGNSLDVRVHYSRVIHVVDGALESEVEGMPRLQPIWNRLKDIEKIVGGSGEMFWRGARPGYQGMVDKEYTLTQEMKDALQDELDEMENNLRRYLLNEGIKWDAMAPQVSDPSKHFMVCVQCISAETGIPMRVLTGSEVGELASIEDRQNWADLIEGRREEFVEPSIIRPMVDRCIELGILPPPSEGYSIKWPDLRTPSDKDKTEVGVNRGRAIRDYTTNPEAAMVVPEEAFLRICLGLSTDEVSIIMEMKEAKLAEMEEERLELVPLPTPSGTPSPQGTPPSQESE